MELKAVQLIFPNYMANAGTQAKDVETKGKLPRLTYYIVVGSLALSR